MSQLSLCTTCVGDGCRRCEQRGTVHPEVQALIDAAPPLTAQQVAILRPIFAPLVERLQAKHRGDAA